VACREGKWRPAPLIPRLLVQDTLSSCNTPDTGFALAPLPALVALAKLPSWNLDDALVPVQPSFPQMLNLANP